MITTGLIWIHTLDFAHTPSGDGSRIMKWLSFVQTYNVEVSIWNPFRNGGYPLFSDPEQFWYLSLFIDVNSEYANITLNALLYLVLITTSVFAWMLARRVGLKPKWAFLVALLVCLSDIAIINERSARFAAIINMNLLLVSLYILVAPQKKLTTYAYLSLLLGLSISLVIQYALPLIIAIYSFLLFDPHRQKTNLVRHFITVSLITFGICLVSLFVSALVTVPLAMHLQESFIPLKSIQYSPVLPSGREFLGTILPYLAGDRGNFISLLVVPTLILVLAFGLPQKVRQFLRSSSLIMLLLCAFVVMSIPFLEHYYLQSGLTYPCCLPSDNIRLQQYG